MIYSFSFCSSKSLESVILLGYNFQMNSNQPTIQIDNDRALYFETNGAGRKVFNFFAIPVLNSLPKNLRGTVKKTHKSAENINSDSSSLEIKNLATKAEKGPRFRLL